MSNPKYPFGYTLDEMDLPTFLSIRNWVCEAVEAHGAKEVGAGVGEGQADIDIELEGFRYNISIRPLPLYSAPDFQTSGERLPNSDAAETIKDKDCASRVCELCGGAGYVTYRDGIAYKTHDVEKEEHLIEDCPECKQAGHD